MKISGTTKFSYCNYILFMFAPLLLTIPKYCSVKFDSPTRALTCTFPKCKFSGVYSQVLQQKWRPR